jgi:hypothetical protein
MIRLASSTACAHKRGGIWFLRLGRFGAAFWYSRRKPALKPSPTVQRILAGLPRGTQT